MCLLSARLSSLMERLFSVFILIRAEELLESFFFNAKMSVCNIVHYTPNPTTFHFIREWVFSQILCRFEYHVLHF